MLIGEGCEYMDEVGRKVESRWPALALAELEARGRGCGCPLPPVLLCDGLDGQHRGGQRRGDRDPSRVRHG